MCKLWCYVVLTLVLTTGCASQEEVTPEEAEQFSAVSVVSPQFQPEAGAAFAWYGPIVWASEAVPHDEALETEMISLVEEGIAAKGYRMVDAVDDADYIIGGALVDGQSEGSSQVRNFFSLYPALGDGSGNLPHTAAMVGVIEADDYRRIGSLTSGELLWRSAVELYVTGDRLPPQTRQTRIRAMAVELMRSLPRAP